MKNHIKALLTGTIGSLMILSCNSYLLSPTSTGSIGLKIQWPGLKIADIPMESVKIHIEVREGSNTQAKADIIRPDYKVKLAKVPVGSKYIVAEARDSHDITLARGIQTAEVKKDKLTTVEITLNRVEKTLTSSPVVLQSGLLSPLPLVSATPTSSATPTVSPIPTPTISAKPVLVPGSDQYTFRIDLKDSLKIKSVFLELYTADYPRTNNSDGAYAPENWYPFDMIKTGTQDGKITYSYTEKLKFQDTILLYRYIYVLEDGSTYCYYPGITNEEHVLLGNIMPAKTTITGAELNLKLPVAASSPYPVNIDI